MNRNKKLVVEREIRTVELPRDEHGRMISVSEYFGENVFDFTKAESIPEKTRQQILKSCSQGQQLDKSHAELVAKAITKWAKLKGATHFCHWFQPLTGATAEKHDAILALDSSDLAIEELSASQLMKGEPDASSFPHGGMRSTFEARGYTTWDLSSPIFIMEGPNGKTVCIPTAFVSYYGDALDIKTPLLRSVESIKNNAVKFLNLIGQKSVDNIQVTCGAEQEYFLVDRAFFYNRPDMIMTGRTLFGSLTAKNQQLEDHYFGPISDRVLAFMQELDHELYRLGIPSKTRHNEVAPGQFEVAPIFKDVNLSADQNHQIMALVQKVAERHQFVALLHEKPFVGINGSGKHLNWSMSDSDGKNLLSPGEDAFSNLRFLSMVAIVLEAVNRHGDALRMSVAGHGNDHRLGANEAPPSIISVYLGDQLTKVLDNIEHVQKMDNGERALVIEGANSLIRLSQDNSDRNRTSPFAFTGNRFEFRAVGSTQSIGFPLCIINAAVSEVLSEACEFLKNSKEESIENSLIQLIKKYYHQSKNIVFNGDGYSEDWVKEARERGLPNLITSADALVVLKDEARKKFLLDQKVFTENELRARYVVLQERYIKHREIEFKTLLDMIHQFVFPAVFTYKKELAELVQIQNSMENNSRVEHHVLSEVNGLQLDLFQKATLLNEQVKKMPKEKEAAANLIAHELMPLSEEIAELCSGIEDMLPDHLWKLPKYIDLLFVR